MSNIIEKGSKNSGSIDAEKKNHNKYRRPKPDIDPDVDKWKQPEWEDVMMKSSLLEESSFACLFPKYRERYLREVWPVVTRALDGRKVACELNLIEGSMTVSTTRRTRDPYAIMKARDLIRLLARSIPAPQALKILNDDVYCDIIKIGGMVRNKDRFVKRRQRLVGPDGATLRALELLTECYMLVQGNTVSVMGPTAGIKQARSVVVDCMNNIHPVYNIKRLMIRKELAKDPRLAEEDWSRFLPSFKKKNVKRKRPLQAKREAAAEQREREEAKTSAAGSAEGGERKKAKRGKGEKKTYTPFPPAQTPSKVDKQLDSGEYFLLEHQRKAKKLAERQVVAAAATAEKRTKRNAEFAPPTENAAADGGGASKKKNKSTPSDARKNPDSAGVGESGVDVKAMKKRLKKAAKKEAKRAAGAGRSAESLIET